MLDLGVLLLAEVHEVIYEVYEVLSRTKNKRK